MKPNRIVEIYSVTTRFRRQKQWRWRVKSPNGETVASGESYVNFADAVGIVSWLLGLTKTLDNKLPDVVVTDKGESYTWKLYE